MRPKLFLCSCSYGYYRILKEFPLTPSRLARDIIGCQNSETVVTKQGPSLVETIVSFHSLQSLMSCPLFQPRGLWRSAYKWPHARLRHFNSKELYTPETQWRQIQKCSTSGRFRRVMTTLPITTSLTSRSFMGPSLVNVTSRRGVSAVASRNGKRRNANVVALQWTSRFNTLGTLTGTRMSLFNSTAHGDLSRGLQYEMCMFTFVSINNTIQGNV